MSDINNNEVIQETTMDVTDKKCPQCGATIAFNPGTMSLSCEYCGYSKQLPKAEAGEAVVEMDFKSAASRSSCEWGTQKKSVVCKMCGAEAIYDALETASNCPFCGSTSVMPVDNIEDVMSPGGIVPFEIDKKKAEEIFKSWLKGKLFAPKAAKESCEAKDFNGIYLPFWTYDCDTTSTYTARLGFEYKDGEEKKIRWQNTSGVYQQFIDDEIVYASKKTISPELKAVSTFDFKKIQPYSPEIVAGFAAERYSVGLDEGWTNAQKTIKPKLSSALTSKLRKQHHADRVEQVKMSTSYDNITFKYLLAPIWMAAFKYNGVVYNIAVNGQTGRISGKSPVSTIRVIIAILIVLAIIGLIFFLNN
ncbi:MAG: hypothetical protein MJ172_02285 [Clostridia bacterium]|nr:hypothetical protein [Clostridia bacterium]